MVPDVEEVGREAQRLLFRQPEILDKRKVPVLLVRTTESVPAEIAEIRGAEVWIVDGVAQRWIKQRGNGESVDVQIPVVHAALNASGSQGASERAAGGQTAGQRAGSKTGPKKRGSRARIRYRERRARLENRDA